MRIFRTMIYLLLQLLLVCLSQAALELETYRIIEDGITVSGLDSGACMATQVHLTYSSIVKGVGMFAGVTYYCAKGLGSVFAYNCRYGDVDTASSLMYETLMLEEDGKIESTLQLRNTSVFLYTGGQDSKVVKVLVEHIRDYYSYSMEVNNIATDSIDIHGHGMPTDRYGAPCDEEDVVLKINNCGYNGAYEMLQHIYGYWGYNLTKPGLDDQAVGDFLEFDQVEFLNGASFDNTGFIYVPSDCISRNYLCLLHFHMHPCTVGRDSVGDQYAREAGFNEVAELNNIIIVYPQVRVSPFNEDGCWDWYGYNDDGAEERGNYATKFGHQTDAIRQMISRVSGGM